MIGDERRIRQILFNLIGNAIKFTPEGGAVSLQAARCNGSTVLRVRDTGIGITRDDRARLFTPFERGDTRTLGRREGTGLGLALVGSLVDAMGGTVDVDSEPDRGSVFTVTLRLPLVNPGNSGNGTGHGSVDSTPTHGLAGEPESPPRRIRLLIAEDNEVLRRAVSEYACDVGHFDITAASSGTELLELLRSVQSDTSPWDAVMLDVQMPDANGLQCARALRADARFARVPVIVTTGSFVDQEYRDRFAAAGVSDIVIKPFRLDHMVKLIRERTASASDD